MRTIKVVLGVFSLTVSTFGQTAVVENLDWMPVQVVQATILPTSYEMPMPSSGPPLHRKTLEITFQNTTAKKVMVLGISYMPGSCGSYMSAFPDRPVVASNGTRTEKTILDIPPNTKIVPTIDFVLFEDGSAYGPDVCNALQEYQSNVGSRRATIDWVLRLLTTIGPQKTEEVLRQELALREKMSPAVTNPRFVRRK